VATKEGTTFEVAIPEETPSRNYPFVLLAPELKQFAGTMVIPKCCLTTRIDLVEPGKEKERTKHGERRPRSSFLIPNSSFRCPLPAPSTES